MSRVVDQGLSHLQVAVHGGSAVRIDLAKIEFPVILPIEQVEARDGQKPFVGRGKQDQLLQFFGEGKELPVILVLAILLYHLAEDSMGDGCDPAEVRDGLLIVNFRDVDGFFENAVVVEWGILEDFFYGEGARTVFFRVLQDMLFVGLKYLLLQAHGMLPFY